MEGGWSVVIATGSPVALAARREGRGRDRQGPADPRVGGPRAHRAWPGRCCDMPPARTRAPRQDADVRQAHAAHTWLTHVAETLTDKHSTYKGGQRSTDGDTYTSHTKTQG